ncbi:hypothetical protein EW026_g1139 [Hermanssonia centrifuga]|uniref:Selenoprotein O n=1 Tax=Hermanssonia centrifuga TaxID=98765 RepID=A0A4S4KSQ6_9APHY|nr:hypothetical protein EW026_g1139 [Hermanssonia centrifuga]
MGLTIDYVMRKVDMHTIIFAVRALLNALAPIIGAEAEQGTALKAGWADDATPEKVDEWRKEGLKLLPEVEETIQDTCADEYKKRIHKRLALRRIDLDDESKLARPLLDLMAEHRLDFHSTFRRLAYFRLSMAETSQGTESNKELDEYIQSVLTLTPEPQMVDQMKASTDLKAWLERYVARIKSEREQWGDDIDAEREKASRAVNPRFVLRQWVLEEVIKKVEQDADSGKRVLRKVLQMACNPFDPWGAEDDPSPEESLDGELLKLDSNAALGSVRL